MSDKSNDGKQAAIFMLMEALRKASRSSLMLRQSIAQSMSLNASDAECIDYLMEMGPASAGDLAEATGLTTGAITAMLSRLEAASLIARTKDPNDGRKVIVTLMPKKHAKASKLYAALAQDIYQLLSGYTASELKFLFRHTQALEEIYKHNTKKR